MVADLTGVVFRRWENLGKPYDSLVYWGFDGD
jgi:hypothetical protein